MTFERDRLPDPRSYYEAQGLALSKGKKWVTTACHFHQGSDSMRINLQSGAFVCMAGCGARGGDVLAYHMAVHGLEFIEAAKDLGAWVDDGKQPPTAPAPFTPRQALEVLMTEVNLIAVVAGNIGRGVVLSETERTRLMQAAGRVLRIAEVYA
ncbi:CHC2 zinc finger domain-containing protein [Delftia tsuruhatensis]|uniref:CHC2 zinc finger domain-containing protein n=1 Tax=Delftia tsuruhatensis TaxID=180282 RepID=UPI00244AF90B|nr:CHC2 zinc finger domain-containing protein [Delftia tsuruhatensis]MDH2229432.1 CHC2 zinc finger domain-containing protein [Delftia tsuruhatensis]